MTKNEINIVWFKRDLRINDHAPLAEAASSSIPTLLLYIFEPAIVDAQDYTTRHWRFVWESLSDLQTELAYYNHKIDIVYGNPIDVFSQLQKQYIIKNLYSHQETGIDLTFQRDKQIKQWSESQQVNWTEFPTNAVYRGLKHRDGWKQKWKDRIISDLITPNLSNLISFSLPNQLLSSLNVRSIPSSWKTPHDCFQPGGPKAAYKYLNDFLTNRASNYNNSISKPEASRTGCSRLSPYLTWGNLSLREVHHAYRKAYKTTDFKRQLKSFESRLKWHCHFIQKFESEPRIEFENINSGFDDIRQDWDEEKFRAWKTGKTGFPLVDACMRAVIQTGYLNFRMRAMLVSFLTHNLWLHWKKGAIHLGRQFLDFEPGIHYPQFQMQAATTGTNSIRIYNPVKQSYDHDPEGIFIKKWVPELNKVPKELVHEPWKMSVMEQEMYECRIGKDYPAPIIKNLKETHRRASDILWRKRKEKKVMQENKRILKKHVKN